MDSIISGIAVVAPEREVFHFHPIAAESYRKVLEKKWIRDGIIKILSEADSDGQFFSSFPTKVSKYAVVIVLRFDKKSYGSFYSLKLDTMYKKHKIACSFVESCVNEFLSAAAHALDKNDSDIYGIERPIDELIRSAAASFISALVCTDRFSTGGAYNPYFYEAVNVISLSRYEESEAVGRLFVVQEDHPSIKTVVRFLNPEKLNRTRSIRKLLETTSDSLALLTDSCVVYGLGVQKDNYDATKEDLYEIRFTKHHTWALIHANNIIMTIEDGMPQLPKEKVNKEKMLSDLKRLFSQNSENQNKNIFELIECATRQKHGTMLVFAHNAKEEAERLSKQSTLIEPVCLTKDLLDNLTTIDGAILISPEGICHAIRVVLDGFASPKGDPARGARYNSAIRYHVVNPCSLVVVISQDGTIDLVPDLKPQFPRAEIDKVIEEANKVFAQGDLNLKDVMKLVQRLEAASFYLNENDCVVGNKLIEILNQYPLTLEKLGPLPVLSRRTMRWMKAITYKNAESDSDKLC